MSESLKDAHCFSVSQELPVRALPGKHCQTVVRRMFSWAVKGGLAITDQALFAGTNFLVNILLARWLTATEYGTFAVAYSVFLLFGAFYTAGLIEPMIVFGAGKFAESFEQYLGILLRGHFRLILPGSFLLLILGLATGRIYSSTVALSFWGLAFAAPFILLLWLLRQAFYVRLRPGWGVAGGLCYLILVLGSLAVLRHSQRLSLMTTFVGMGAAASVVSTWLLIILAPMWTVADRSLRTVFNDHWHYGRWSVASAGVSWLPGNIYYLLLPIWFGMEGAGTFRALMNFALPVSHAVSALSLILLPVLVRDRKETDVHRMAKTMRSFLLLYVFGSMLYLGTLCRFRSEAFQLFYLGRYHEYTFLSVFLVGLLPFGGCLIAVLGSGLRALERPDCIFWSNVSSSVVTVIVGIPLVSIIGITGALLGQLLSSLVAGAVMYRFYLRAGQIRFGA